MMATREFGLLKILCPTCRYFILQLAESQLTQRLFSQIIRRIERLAWHPT